MTEETTNIPYFTEDISNLPETLHNLYNKDEQGGYTLAVEGVAPKRKLDEFRTNNKKLQEQVQELQEKYQFVDIEEYKSLKEKVADKDTKGFVPQTDIEKEVEKRVRKMASEYEQKSSSLHETINSQTSQLSKLLIDNEVAKTATQNNAIESALDDIMMRVRTKFTVEEGKVVAKDEAGEIEYNANGDPVTIAQYMNTLKESAPHLFKTSTGAGTVGSRTVQQTNTKNQQSGYHRIANALKNNK
tara:strand:+ start:2758 stop:3489 length:732 start_codon:yes stop_codon:yes gene_type:complete